MKFPFMVSRIEAPPKVEDFKPHRGLRHDKMSEEDQELSDSLSIGEQRIEWANRQAVQAWNLAAGAWNGVVVLAALELLINGVRVLAYAQGFIMSFLQAK